VAIGRRGGKTVVGVVGAGIGGGVVKGEQWETGGWLKGTVAVFAGLIEVPFDCRNGKRRVATEKFGSETREIVDVIAIDGRLKGANCRGKKGSVGESDEFAGLRALVDGDVGGMVAGDGDGPKTSDGIAVS
jgi:hypothetical protein